MAISMMLTLSKNTSLGAGSTMSWTTKEDKEWFKTVTTQIGTIVMGRKTFETMNNKPLPSRINYIITTTPEKIKTTSQVIPLTYEQFKSLKLNTFCVVGGYEIYKLFISDVQIIYLSKHKNIEVDGPVFDLDLSNCVLYNKNETDELAKEIYIKHPHKSNLLNYIYNNDEFLQKAKLVMDNESLDPGWPVGLVYVKNKKIISSGANGSTYHNDHICERKRLKIPTGQGYELCEGCHPKNHGETKGINKSIELNTYDELKDSVAYMYGHWWACEPCTTNMLKAKVDTVVFSKSWTKNYFNIIDF